MIYARIETGAVAELFTPPAGVPIEDCFHAGLTWVDVTNVSPQPQQGWSATQHGATWAFAAPVIAPADQAAAELATRIAGGITITSTGTSTISAVYALDRITMDQIGSVARDDAAGLGLPGGAATFSYPDASGTMRALTGAQVQALYKAQRDLLFALNTQAAALAQGGTPVWPDQTAIIL